MLVVLLIGALDVRAGKHLLLVALYAVPVAWVGWRVGCRAGVALAVLAGVVALAADLAGASPPAGRSLVLWNAASGTGVLLFIVLLLHQLRRFARTLEDRVADRTRDLDRDITKRHQVEAALRESEERYKALFDRSPEVVFLTDFEGNFLDANQAALDLLGYRREEIPALRFDSIVSEDQLPEAFRNLAELKATGHQKQRTEYRVRRKDGREVFLETQSSLICREGKPWAAQGIARDVTARKRAERQAAMFARLAKQLSATASAEAAGQVIMDAADELLGWDACFLYLHDRERDEIQRVISLDTIAGRKSPAAFHTADRKPTALFRRVLREGKQLILRDPTQASSETGVRFGDKQRPSASLMYVPIRRGEEAVGVMSIQSYTPRAYDEAALDTLQALADHCAAALQRIYAQESLQGSEARYRLLVENQGEGVGIVDRNEVFAFANPAAERIFGVARGALTGRSLIEFLSAEQGALLRQQTAQRASAAPDNYELVITRPGGTERVLLVTATPQPNEHGEYDQTFSIFRDITERKRAELMVARSELRLRQIWDDALVPMRLTDTAGTIVMANQAYCELVAKAREELEGELMSVVYQPAARDQVLRNYAARFARGNDLRRRAEEVIFWNGRRASLEIAETFLVLHGQPPLLLSVARDLTERQEMESQLRQMQKLESIGQLAAGVAHDFNNLLAVVQGHVELLLMDTPADAAATHSLHQIADAARRGANLTRQLLLFSRKQAPQVTTVDLNPTIQDLGKMLRRVLGEHITLQFACSAAPALVRADASMMEQVCMNLAVNARDAMPNGGVLRIETEVLEIGEEEARHTPEAASGPHVCLSVADTGCGIPPEIQPRVFDPFFTTKEVGKGTGLGLATVHGIIKQHHGWIRLHSSVGRGTTFEIYLPLARAADSDAVPSAPKAAPAPSGNTILVAEDEATLREVMSHVLLRRGYQVLTAASGPEALKVAAAAGQKIDLLLTDMVMPGGMTGRELAGVLQAQQPDLEVIFTSGYSAEMSDTTFLQCKETYFLPKPYSTETLCQTVAERLQARARGRASTR